MTLATIACMAVTLAGAVIAVNARNVMRAVLALALALVGVAGLFLLLGSPFVAAMEILIYVGGISVMMIFAVMLSYSISANSPETSMARRALALLPSLGFLGLVAFTMIGTDFGTMPETSAEAWSVQAVGRALLTEYALNFELLSMVLLLAIVGSVTIARQFTDEADQEDGGASS
jgi:NADH-quinone oxidoreductase subunit J